MKGTKGMPYLPAVFVFFLCATQLVALGLQFVKGFRPFGHEPTRVPFSWDMFANRVERCDLQWVPSLETRVGKLASLRQLGMRMEWDVTYDRMEYYREVGKFLCHSWNQKSQVRLHCFLPNGTETHDAVDCG